MLDNPYFQSTMDILSVLPQEVVLTANNGEEYDKALNWWSDTSFRRPRYLIQARDAHDVSKAASPTRQSEHILIADDTGLLDRICDC